MDAANLHPRFVMPRLIEALDDTPVVLIHGPRQCGKTTLAQELGAIQGHQYFSLDDSAVLAAARRDPAGFVADLPEKVILDEVQRAPEIFSAIKLTVDKGRRPGRFLLTGSANLLHAPQLPDSLAGRMEILRLYPLSQAELSGQVPRFLDELLAAKFTTRKAGRLGKDLAQRIARGGFPAAMARKTAHRRSRWYQDYIESLVQRDVRDLVKISAADALPRLLSLTAGQTAHLINFSELSSPFQLSRTTIREYVLLLEKVFLLEELQPWHSNRLSRLVKTPKLHIGDTGLSTALLGLNGDDLYADRMLLGQQVETFVFQELRRQASWREEPLKFFHYRDKDQAEVDMVIEGPKQQIWGVEVKASATLRKPDWRGLNRLRAAMGDRFVGGVMLYDGEELVPYGSGFWAVPISYLWTEE